MAKGYSAYVLTEASREKLLKLFPPRYENVIAHHVTWEFGVHDSMPPPVTEAALVYARADDRRGVEALLVVIDGVEHRRDGKSMHITWSLAEGRKPVESNDVIEAGHCSLIKGLIIVDLEPRFIPFGA